MDQINYVGSKTSQEMQDLPIGGMAVDSGTGEVLVKTSNGTTGVLRTCGYATSAGTAATISRVPYDYEDRYTLGDIMRQWTPAPKDVRKMFGLVGFTLTDKEINYILDNWNNDESNGIRD